MTSVSGDGGDQSESPDAAPCENRLLRARARGELSTEDAFAALYQEYARTVAAWVALRTGGHSVEDLTQEVWLVFYSRFSRWEFGTEMESEQARPVLSFLFRTCQYVARAHNRLRGRARSFMTVSDDVENVTGGEGVESLSRRVEASRALSTARRICSEAELDVLLAKLAGMKAKEIAAALSITEASVDHRYRRALSRLRNELVPNRAAGGSHD